MNFLQRFARGFLAGVGAVASGPQLQAAIYGPGIQLNNMSRDDQVFWRSIGWGGGGSKAGVNVTENTALNLPVVYACINRISNPIARFPIKIMQPKNGGGSEEVTDHPMSQSLGLRPNELMSSRTLRKTVQGHALLWGNGYCEIERNGRGQAVGLWPLMPWATEPKYEGGRFIYRATINNRQTDLDYDQVIHIMDMSQDGYCGQSPIRRAANALGLAFAAEEFGSKFFANDAKSGGFLMHPGRLGDPARENLKASIESKSGLDYAHKIRVLEEGMKWIQTTIPPEDAQFLGTRAMQIAEIARIYDVPRILLQESDGTSSWGTGIEQLMIGFVRQTLEPWVHAWEQEFNWKLFTQDERDQGYFVKMNMKALMRGDSAAQAVFFNQLFQVGGFSPNRILELLDEDQIGPEGNLHFVPSNMQTLEQAYNAPATPPAATQPGIPAPPGIDQRQRPAA